VRLRRRQLTKQQHPGLKDAFQVLQNVGIGEGEERRFLSHLRGRDIQAVATLLRERKNTDQGTSVAGLICWGIQLNPTIASLDDGPCGVYDLQVIPNDDPAKGSMLPLFESEFLQTLDEALKQHANKYKVWNFSLGTSRLIGF
jgi:hypothetical protein